MRQFVNDQERFSTPNVSLVHQDRWKWPQLSFRTLSKQDNSVLNTRPRDFYDVYIIMKTQRQAMNKEIFISAFNATSKKRRSLAAMLGQNKILLTIQSDPTMRQRWDRYCKENYYAMGIEFDQVIGVLFDLTN